MEMGVKLDEQQLDDLVGLDRELDPDYVIFNHFVYGYWNGSEFDDFNRVKRYRSKAKALKVISNECMNKADLYSSEYKSCMTIIEVY